MSKWCVVLLLAVIVSGLVWAQGGPSGAISIMVKDESGAVVPGAAVTMTNMGTGLQEREGTTGPDGVYRASILPIGRYTITVTNTGFQRMEVINIPVRVTETTSVAITLSLGAIEQSVTVTGTPTAVQLNNPTTGQVVSNVGQLPLVTRNILQILALSPGVSTDLNDTAALGRGNVSIEVNGQKATSNNYQLEGINANDYNLPQFANVPVPNPSAVAEFRTQTSLYDASQGRNPGGNVQVAMKSGTSKFHGDVFEFFRNDHLNANDFFLNQQGGPKPVLKQNQFGGSLGGPIPMTGAFFFVNYQGTRQRSGLANGTQLNSLLIALPTDRSATNLANSFNVPAGAINPVSLALLNLQGSKFPGPGGYLIPSVAPTVPGSIPQGRLVQSIPGRYTDDQFVANMDKQIRSRDKISGRWFFSDNDTTRPFFTTPIVPRSLPFASSQPGSNRFLSLSETHTFSPTLLNQFRFGYNRFTFSITPEELIGLSDISATRGNQAQFPGAFQVNVAAPGFIIGPGVNDNRGGAFNTFEWADTVSKTWGKHNLRFGLSFTRYQLNRFNNFATRGSVSFVAANPLSAFQNFLLGNIRTTQGGSGFFNFYFRNTDASAFMQDDWKVTSRLTVNLGLRWEPFAIAHEKNDLLTNLEGINDNLAPNFVFPGDLTLRSLGTPGVDGCTLKDCRFWGNVAPRAGFAYDPTGSAKWAIRGGYGIYYNRFSNQLLLQSTGGNVFQQAVSGTGTPFNNPFPTLRPQSDFPLTPQPLAHLASVANGGLGAPTFTGPLQGFLFFADRNFRAPYVQQWNLTVQHEVYRNWLAEIGYVGTKGTALVYSNANFNQALPVNAANPLVQPTTAGTMTITGSTLGNLDARVPAKWLGIPVGRLEPQTNDGASTYHALQTSMTRRFGESYFQAAYTFSHSIDNQSGSQADQGDELNGNTVFNGNQRLTRGLSDFDRRHRLVMSYAWELPFFRHTAGWRRSMLGGWGTSAVITLQSGIPFTVVDSAGGNLLGLDICCFSTAQVVKSDYHAINGGGTVQKRLDQYFDTSAFAPVPCVDSQLNPVSSCSAPSSAGSLIGNSGRNVLRGPFQEEWDFGVFKRFHVTERQNIEFRTELFNIFNHPSFAAPGCGTGACSAPTVDIQNGAAAGAITSTTNRPRVIQFVLKYNW